jgi:diguanylate cyclase (GGDEF)-like protein
MDAARGSWATQQLAELLALLSSCQDESEATRTAVERAAEALEAEAAAMVRDERIGASIGFPSGIAPVDEFLDVALGRGERITVPGVGSCAATAIPVEGERPAWLVLARASEDGFSREEIHLLRGMARVLTLTTRLIERQRLLERLAEIQRSIVHRGELRHVLQAVTQGAHDLLGQEVVGLRLVDADDESRTHLVAETGVEPEISETLRQGEVGEGAGGRAISEDQLVVIEGYPPASNRLTNLDGLQAAMAAPVHRNGKPCGSLVVASYEPGRRYGDTEKEVLLAFAEHASLAITDASNFEDALHQAFHDSLTGLPNRELFSERLSAALQEVDRTGGMTAVLFLDLDGFKTVNDSLGHVVGDDLLVAVGGRLKGSLRPDDLAARFGGDEFAVLLEGLVDIRDAERIAERVLDSLRKPFSIGEHDLSVTASVGIAGAGSSDVDLLRDADLAMYQAKGGGKNRFESYEPGMHKAVVSRLALEADLQRAIERHELRLHYQPIVRLRTGRIIGVEALVRWQHPERGLMPPIEFVPLAEETGLIVPLGRWVLNEACHRAAAWQRLHPALALGVNLSSVQLTGLGLRAEVSQALSESGLDPRSLILEITETVLMHDVDSTAKGLRELKDLGVQLAVDDFGTGYSSLQYLRGLPIDILKIAKSFVDGVAGASGESALARAIIDLGDSFQLRVVAEGIEARDQLNSLLELGCELGQGFLFARPQEPGDLEALLKAQKPLTAVMPE